MATLKTANIIKAWKEGCSDVKTVIENLFPDVDFNTAMKYKKSNEVLYVKVQLTKVDPDESESYPYELTLVGLKMSGGDPETIAISEKSMDKVVKVSKELHS